MDPAAQAFATAVIPLVTPEASVFFNFTIIVNIGVLAAPALRSALGKAGRVNEPKTTFVRDDKVPSPRLC